MQIQAFAVEVLTGEMEINGVPQEHIIDVSHWTYRLTTTLPDCEELRRVIQCALSAGQAVGREFVRDAGAVRVKMAG